MRLEKPTPWKLIIKSGALFLWIIGGIFSFGLLFLLGYLWIIADVTLSIELRCSSLILLLLICRTLLVFRLPTVNAIFDKQKGYFVLEKKWIWTYRTLAKYPLAAVRNVQVVQKGRFGKASLYFKIKVELISGEIVPISVMNYRPEAYVRMIATELIDFLESTYLLDLAAKQRKDNEAHLQSSLER
ncbi:MAG: hypothetical protein H6662_00545 [Ardenticatenaceae bacterium]|nr:hypothetical protein [Anaerolineales bacterium]MCB8920045.1 hypothetical protein [Ardenticatenaceae bacterium]MCB8989890.1 hypothetical protein [Ardenticatenaceae bacterium]